jgi:hypothetical protein
LEKAAIQQSSSFQSHLRGHFHATHDKSDKIDSWKSAMIQRIVRIFSDLHKMLSESG